MAAKKKKKKTVTKTRKKAPVKRAAKKAAKKATKKAPARKAKKTKPAKKAKATKKTKRSTGVLARVVKAVKKAVTPAKKKKKKQIVGEGDYQASRAFLKDQSSFVEKNRDRIPALGQEAEKALDGPEGDELRAAEATAADRSRDTY